MRSISLRPMVIYGDLDQHFVSQAVRAGLENRKTMLDFCGLGKCCVVYAGNVAWAFNCAHKAMTSDRLIGGDAFLVKDDTPYKSMVQFCKPYFDAFDIKVYKSFIPYWAIYLLIWLIQLFLYLISPLKKLQFPLTLSTLIYTNLIVTFEGSKAEKILKYKPLYDADESFKRSLEYYKSTILSNKKNK